MEAKLKSSYPINVIRALEGREYVKYEWRGVPAGREAEAQKHPDLETRVPEPPADQIGPVAPREHVTDGTPCWCNPEIQDVEGSDVKVVVHRDQDGELIPESKHPLGQPHDEAEEEKMRAAAASAADVDAARLPDVDEVMSVEMSTPEPAPEALAIEGVEPATGKAGKGRGKKAKE